VVAGKSPDFVADVKLLSSEANGRKTPLREGEWRTVLGVNGEYWSAMLKFEGEQAPGATFEVNVGLLVRDLALPMFEVGKIFEVWEGGTKAWGCVKQIMGRSA